MYTLSQIILAGLIAFGAVAVGGILARTRVKIIKTPHGIGLGIGHTNTVSLHLNRTLAEFDKTADYEREVKPTADAFHAALNRVGLSGMAVATTKSDKTADNHQTQGCCAFLGPDKTTDEMLIAYEFAVHGLERGAAALMATIMVHAQGVQSETDGVGIFMTLAKAGLNKARAEKGLPPVV